MRIPVAVPPNAAPKLPTPPGRTAPSDAEDAGRQRERDIDEALEQSFPASDPPSWTLGVTRSDPATPDRAGARRIH
jgi:hypothetical protein